MDGLISKISKFDHKYSCRSRFNPVGPLSSISSSQFLLPIQVSGLIEKLRGQCEGVPEESEEIRERAEKSRVDFLLLVRDLKDEEDLAEEGEEEQERLQVSLISSLFTKIA